MSRVPIIRLLVLAPLLPLASAFAPVMSTKPPKIVVCGGGVIGSGCTGAHRLLLPISEPRQGLQTWLPFSGTNN